MNIGGRGTVVGFAHLAVKKKDMGKSLLVALKRGGVKMCGLADALVLSKALYLLAADKETIYIGRISCSLREKCLCGLGVWLNLLRF